MVGISYGVLVCNEAVELNRLLGNLTAYLRPEDEIIVLIDSPKASLKVWEVITSWRRVCENLSYYQSEFKGNFAEWREELASYCTKDWIFQIDADELVDLGLLRVLPKILEKTPESSAYALSRANTVVGLTQEDVDRWHWHVNEAGLVNWPDIQYRLYPNDGTWRWEGQVHERLVGNGMVSVIRTPTANLYHPKDIERQRRQNAFYETYNS